MRKLSEFIHDRRSRCGCLRPVALLFLPLLFLGLTAAALGQEEKGNTAQEDGPINITVAYLFKDGKVRLSDIDPAKVAPMPRGYVSYRNEGFKLETDAVASGPNVIDFAVPSISDRELFGKLRVLCTEWDKVDEKPFWVDCTIDPPDEHARDFDSRRVSARTESGTFALAVREPANAPPPLPDADLSVEVVAPMGSAVANREVDFEVKVTNYGPNDAADIGVRGAGFSSNEFVSASAPTQGNGRCRQDGSNYGCKLDRLAKGETAVFHVVLRPDEGLHGKWSGNQPLFLLAFVYSRQRDPNPNNNNGEARVAVSPDPNAAPSLKLLSPTEGTIFTSPANIKLSAEASDPEGKVAKVEFYDGGKLIGKGRAESKGVYTLDWADAPPGSHGLTAIVTDDGGRADYKTVSIFVNGSLSVSIRKPPPDAVFNLKAISNGEESIGFEPLSFEVEAAVATHGHNIKEVVFVLYPTGNVGPFNERKEVAKPAGVDATTGEELYTAAFEKLAPSSYLLTAVATNEDGAESIARVKFRANAAPLIWLKSERNPVTSFKAPASVPLVATLLHVPLFGESSEKVRVDFYADGKLIGSVEADRFRDEARFVWENAPPGQHSITAIATDSEGAASNPAGPLLITVQN